MGIVNLDNVIGKYMHYPRVKDNASKYELPPLYAKVTNGKNIEAKYRNQTWLNESRIRYNSPNNVRRLFITKNSIILNLYRPIVAPTQDSSLWVRIAYRSTDTFESIAEKARLGEQIVGTGLSGIWGEYVMSNIEEICIDPDMLLLSNKICDIGNIENGRLTGGSIKRFVDSSNRTGFKSYSEFPAEMLMNIYIANNTSKTEYLRINNKYERMKKFYEERFNKLKIVSFINNLENVYKNANLVNSSSREYTFTEHLISTHKNDDNVAVQYSSITRLFNKKTDNTIYKKDYELTTRPGIYVFDEKVLSPYVLELNNKYEEMVRQEKAKIKSSLEAELDTILNWNEHPEYKDHDKLVIKNIVSCGLYIADILDNTSRDRLNVIYKEMSESGRNKYLDIRYKQSNVYVNREDLFKTFDFSSDTMRRNIYPNTSDIVYQAILSMIAYYKMDNLAKDVLLSGLQKIVENAILENSKTMTNGDTTIYKVGCELNNSIVQSLSVKELTIFTNTYFILTTMIVSQIHRGWFYLPTDENYNIVSSNKNPSHNVEVGDKVAEAFKKLESGDNPIFYKALKDFIRRSGIKINSSEYFKPLFNANGYNHKYFNTYDGLNFMDFSEIMLLHNIMSIKTEELQKNMVYSADKYKEFVRELENEHKDKNIKMLIKCLGLISPTDPNIYNIDKEKIKESSLKLLEAVNK